HTPDPRQLLARDRYHRLVGRTSKSVLVLNILAKVTAITIGPIRLLIMINQIKNIRVVRAATEVLPSAGPRFIALGFAGTSAVPVPNEAIAIVGSIHIPC